MSTIFSIDFGTQRLVLTRTKIKLTCGWCGGTIRTGSNHYANRKGEPEVHLHQACGIGSTDHGMYQASCKWEG